MPDAAVISEMLASAITGSIATTPRSLQKDEGRLGPSDLGFCRNKAALVTKQIEPSDSRNMIWPAGVGTAIHTYVEDIITPLFPDWIVEGPRVNAVFPNGAVVSGTPDILVPDENMVLDIKTVDGFSWVKREGASQNHKFQRATYALGACQGAILDSGRPVYVGNAYFDRSGKEQKPHVAIEELNWSIIDEVSAWIDDVIYAVKHNEDAQRDIAAPVCERICEFYTVCRGDLPSDDAVVIRHPDLVGAIDMYVDGRNMKKEGDRMMTEAKPLLAGLNGSDGRYQVRTTHVPASEIAGFTRSSYDKIDVVKVRNK